MELRSSFGAGGACQRRRPSSRRRCSPQPTQNPATAPRIAPMVSRAGLAEAPLPPSAYPTKAKPNVQIQTLSLIRTRIVVQILWHRRSRLSILPQRVVRDFRRRRDGRLARRAGTPARSIGPFQGRLDVIAALFPRGADFDALPYARLPTTPLPSSTVTV
jgi:hypothetical protein